jgi:hypothetical protein
MTQCSDLIAGAITGEIKPTSQGKYSTSLWPRYKAIRQHRHRVDPVTGNRFHYLEGMSPSASTPVRSPR